eukprot:541215-Pleurochrysis_carterae.AAC.1
MPSGRNFGNDNYRRFSGSTRTLKVILSRKIKPPYFQHPPVQVFWLRALCVDIHDLVTHLKKHAGWKRFSDKIRKVFHGVEERHGDVVLFHPLADEEVTP